MREGMSEGSLLWGNAPPISVLFIFNSHTTLANRGSTVGRYTFGQLRFTTGRLRRAYLFGAALYAQQRELVLGNSPRRPEVRVMELLQDAVVVLLNVTLFGMGFMFLYRVWRKIIALGNLQERLSNIVRGDHDRALPALGPLPEVLQGGPEHPRRGGRAGDNPEGDPGRGGGVHHAAGDRIFTYTATWAASSG